MTVDDGIFGYSHGTQQCRVCFANPATPWHSSEATTFAVRGHRWQLRANPGYWGAAAPRILVLGFSKGPEQNRLIEDYVRCDGRTVRFEDIPFNDKKKLMRPNLKKILIELGVIDKSRNTDTLFQQSEQVFGFASLVRCTVTYAKPGSDNFVGSGGGITARTLELDPAFVGRCVSKHLVRLPASVRLVVMLGATTGFVDSVRKMLRGEPLVEKRPRSYAYLYAGKPILHVPHPSGGNNGAIAVFCGERQPTSESEKNIPECKEQVAAAMSALRRLWAESSPEDHHA